MSKCHIVGNHMSRLNCSVFIPRLAPEGVDIVLDCMCGEETNKGISLLKPMGKYILYGKLTQIRIARNLPAEANGKIHLVW